MDFCPASKLLTLKNDYKMKNCKQTFTSSVQKCGYLKVGRNQLKSLFSMDMEQRQLAQILLCVQTFAYFSEGQVCTSEGTYICRPGEWITSYTKIGELTQMHRHLIKTRMKKLENLHLLTIEHMKSCKRISLTNYEQQIQTTRLYSSTPSDVSTKEVETGDSLFAGAEAFYAPVGGQKGEKEP